MTELVEPVAAQRGGEDAATGAPVPAQRDGGDAATGVPVPARWCDRCGEDAATGGHEACAAARALEPPRYCAYCRRRMKVQVLPVGWSAVCVAHGESRG